MRESLYGDRPTRARTRDMTATVTSARSHRPAARLAAHPELPMSDRPRPVAVERTQSSRRLKEEPEEDPRGAEERARKLHEAVQQLAGNLLAALEAGRRPTPCVDRVHNSRRSIHVLKDERPQRGTTVQCLITCDVLDPDTGKKHTQTAVLSRRSSGEIAGAVCPTTMSGAPDWGATYSLDEIMDNIGQPTMVKPGKPPTLKTPEAYLGWLCDVLARVDHELDPHKDEELRAMLNDLTERARSGRLSRNQMEAVKRALAETR